MTERNPCMSGHGTPKGMVFAILAVAVWLAVNTLASQVDAGPQGPTPSTAAEPTPLSGHEPKEYTDAERISGLQQLLTNDQGRIEQLRDELSRLESDFEQASKDFRRLDAALSEKTKQAENIPGDLPPEEAAAMQSAIAELKTKRKVAQDVFDLLIKRRKTTQLQIATLEEKIQLELEALDRANGVEPPPDDEPSAAPSAPEAPVQGTASERAPATVPSDATPKGPVQLAADPPAPAATPNGPEPFEDASSVQTADPTVDAARKEFEAKRSILQDAEQRVERLSRGLSVFERDIANERQMRDNANQRVQLAEDALQRLHTQLEKQTADGASLTDLDATREHIEKIQEEMAEAASAAESHVRQIAMLQAQLAAIEPQKEDALTQLHAAQSETEKAGRRLRWLESPFAPHKIRDWFVSRGPKILMVLLIIGGFWWLFRFLARRMVRGLMRRSRSGTTEEREDRAQTLVGVLNSVTTIALVGIGLLAVLDQAGVDVTVLMGGAAALGVAIGFGAQNLMRDYFYGSMILAENQYRVGHVVKMAGVSGLVESFSLRTTVLRDVEGVVHFIPHSQITTVSNLTHGWSRAVFEIGVAYKENVDRVMDVLMDLAGEMRKDPDFQYLILDDPEMLGVDAFGDSAVVIKFFIKTRPLKQWPVRRELLRRIKNRFDELGIEIPFPHRTVYHRDATSMSEGEHGRLREST